MAGEVGGTIKWPLEQIGKRGNLVASLSQLLEKQIVEGRFEPGARLPTEAELASGAGVSRTVVREAVASLRAAGLVESRQGAGVFVLPFSPGLPRFAMPARGQIEDILFVLELRLAVEVEAATLAANRRTDADIGALNAALETMVEAQQAGSAGIAGDVAFHRAIATATQNPYFLQFLTSLGESAMPRQRISSDSDHRSDMGPYLALVLGEHRAIAEAIMVNDSALAAAAMRSHLAGSRSRYSKLLKNRVPAVERRLTT